MAGVGNITSKNLAQINRSVRACDYLSVAQLFLRDNFFLERPLESQDIKPRLLGHWGTCHGINVAYANLRAYFGNNPNFHFVLGPGHGFPALQANLFIDKKLQEVDPKATLDKEGIAYICKNFSWPDGFPSHASPFTPGIIAEGGELGYALTNAYGLALGHPEKTIAVLIGDGELETATALASLNLKNLLSGPKNGKILPILHLNGYKISAPSIYARKPEIELDCLIAGFGYEPVWIKSDEPLDFQLALYAPNTNPFFILETPKGATGPNEHHESHQIPLKNPKTDRDELKTLEKWLRSYNFNDFLNIEGDFNV